MVGFTVSVWLAIGSTLYPPSQVTMGVLPSYADKCAAGNLTLTPTPPQDLEAISVLHNSDQGFVKKTKTGYILKINSWT